MAHAATAYFIFSSRRRHTRCLSDWSSDVCSSDLLRQTRIDIFEVDTQRATTALHQHLEIAAGLRCLHDAKAVVMTGYVDIHRIVAGDLQEYSGIRAAFVCLPGRMLEARSEAEAGSGKGLVANARSHRCQSLRVRLVA